jgi:hypothetical protein
MQTITDEVGSGPIKITSQLDEGDRRADERDPQTYDDVDAALDGKRQTIGISYRPDGPMPHASLVAAVDNGPSPVATNDNRPIRYHLKEMAKRGELGTSEPENWRHWFDSEHLKRDLAISSGEPLKDSASQDWRELAPEYIGDEVGSLATDVGLHLSDDVEFEDTDSPGECGVVDNANGECDQIRVLHARQVVSLAEQVLGHDFVVLKSAIVDNWTARMFGENELFMDRASASACGKGMLRSALRNLSRFYANLDRLELSGDRPLDVWPLIGTPQSLSRVVLPGPFRWQGNSYWNQARGPVIKLPERAAA